MRPRFLPLVLAAACASKGGQGARGQGGEAAEVVVPEAPAGAAWRTARGVAWEEMLEDLATADVVCLSFFGDLDVEAGSEGVRLVSPADDLYVPVLDYLYKRGRLHAIALDAFPRTAQAALDDFSFGRIDESELAKRVGDLGDGKILSFARERRLPLLALRVEPEIENAVSQGGLEALTEEQRLSLPAVHDTDPKTEPYPLVPHGPTSIGLMLDVAADVIVRWYRDAAPEGAQVAVIAWSQPPRSLPERLHARNGKSYRTLVALPGAAEAADPVVFTRSYSDYVWFTGGK
ncbi:MAG TPA: ChaN family lipoprotein [Planctomycetota bacterium]|nr:ChaN family lipoprotein [Planctomycetota bacterium]